MIRVRFAPSPTGTLHVGNARTALFNWLYARKEKGAFILRMEDTDLARSTQESMDSIVADLKWLGLDWDEGYLKGGDCGPYRQSEKLEDYRKLAAKLVEMGKAYYCYESESEMEEERQDWIKDHVKKRHPHRDLTPAERADFEAKGRKPSIRFATDGLLGEVVYDDLVRGEVKVDLNEIRDFNLMKSDGMPMYNFACVADDHAMKITHVLRGEDGISNTPRQLLIYKALGWDPPQYGHVSFLLGADGQKLSKRHGSSSVAELRSAGYLPEAVVNYLCLLGLGGHGEGEETFSREQMMALFDTNHLIKKSSIFDFGKLDFLNAHYLRLKPAAELAELVKPFLTGMQSFSDAWLIEAVDVFKGNAVKLTDFQPIFKSDFRDTAIVCAEAVTKAREIAVAKTALAGLSKAFDESFPSDAMQTQALLKAVMKETGVKGKDFFMPVRLALTDVEHGPELNRLIPLIGRDRCLKRLEVFLSALN